MMSGCGILTNGKGTRREYGQFNLDELTVSLNLRFIDWRIVNCSLSVHCILFFLSPKEYVFCHF